MKMTLINPPRSIGKGNIWRLINSITPPIGLATLAAIAEEEGISCNILDANALDLDDESILSSISEDSTIIGFSSMTPEINTVIRLCRRIRGAFPRTRIVLGGIHPSIFHRELVQDGTADMVVRGEGEEAIRAIARKLPYEQVPNLTWKSLNGAVVENPQAEEYVDLDKIPFPAYDKLPMEKYHSALGAAIRQPSIGIISSRGCPGSCTFCCSRFFGKKLRQFSGPRTVELMKLLYDRFGIREFSFYDDTFTARPSRVYDICRHIQKWGVNISWSCFARVDTVSPELLHQMKQAGCHQVMYGFESSDDKVLETINKKVDHKKAAQAARWTREAGIDVRGAFMLGNPGETEESLKRTIRYSISLKIPLAIYNITTPFPGTAMYEWAKTNNLLLHTDWDQYDLAHAILRLPALPAEMVQGYYRKAFLSFYLRFGAILMQLRSRMAKLLSK